MPDRFTDHFCFAAGLSGLLAIVLPALLMGFTGQGPSAEVGTGSAPGRAVIGDSP